MHEVLVPFPALHVIGTAKYSCDSSSWEVGGGGPKLQGLPPHRDLGVSLGYLRSYVKKENKLRKNKQFCPIHIVPITVSLPLLITNFNFVNLLIIVDFYFTENGWAWITESV